MKNKVLTLWKKKSKKDKIYYTGYIELVVHGQVKIVAFPNYEKKDESHPSLIGYLSEDKQENADQESNVNIDDDDVPF